MGKGITIKITRAIETRERRQDEVKIRIQAGEKRVSVDAVPYSPDLAYIYGTEPQIVRTKIEFPPPGTVCFSSLIYQKKYVPQLRAMGILK